jgi:hypothetical protein
MSFSQQNNDIRFLKFCKIDYNENAVQAETPMIANVILGGFLAALIL